MYLKFSAHAYFRTRNSNLKSVYNKNQLDISRNLIRDNRIECVETSQVENIFHEDHFWKLVPSGGNPADIISRGMTPDELAGNVLWYFGAKFLQLPESSWPVLKPGDNFINKQADGELKFIDNSPKQA